MADDRQVSQNGKPHLHRTPTNTPADNHELLEPYATEQNMKIFAELQKLEGVGLVVPVEEEHMYFAAMKSKGCELTSIGKCIQKKLSGGILL